MILKFVFFPIRILIGVYWIPVAVYGEGCENYADFAAKEQCCLQNGLIFVGHYYRCNVCQGVLKGCPICQPQQHVACINHRCLCNKGYGYHFGYRRCQAAVGYNENCDESINLYCEDFMQCNPFTLKCECRSGYEYDIGLKECIKSRGEYGDKCRTNPDSCDSDENIECKNNYCVAKFGYFFNCKDNQCVKYKEHGDDCSSTTLCDPERGFECKYNVCACKEVYNHNPRKNNCEEIKPLIPFWVWKWLAITTGVIVILVLFCYVIHSCSARRKRAEIQAKLKREKSIHPLSQSQGESSPSIHKQHSQSHSQRERSASPHTHHSRSQSQGVRSYRKKSRKSKNERKK